MPCSTSAFDATAARIAPAPGVPGAAEGAGLAAIVGAMELPLSDEELERLEVLPLDERAAALEELERRLRDALDDAVTA